MGPAWSRWGAASGTTWSSSPALDRPQPDRGRLRTTTREPTSEGPDRPAGHKAASVRGIRSRPSGKTLSPSASRRTMPPAGSAPRRAVRRVRRTRIGQAQCRRPLGPAGTHCHGCGSRSSSVCRPVSSSSSRAAAARGVSPGSTLPPGEAGGFADFWPGSRSHPRLSGSSTALRMAGSGPDAGVLVCSTATSSPRAVHKSLSVSDLGSRGPGFG